VPPRLDPVAMALDLQAAGPVTSGGRPLRHGRRGPCWPAGARSGGAGGAAARGVVHPRAL
jgi:hypothetical protein